MLTITVSCSAAPNGNSGPVTVDLDGCRDAEDIGWAVGRAYAFSDTADGFDADCIDLMDEIVLRAVTLTTGEKEYNLEPKQWHPDDIATLLDKYDPDAFAAYIDIVGEHYANVADFAEAYRGEWNSPGAFAQNYADELGLIDSANVNRWPLAGNIDWDGAFDDLDEHVFVNGHVIYTGAR